MKVTHIYHSSFAVELAESNLLFDFWEGDGDTACELPEFDRTKPLYVFVSHVHHDHYDPKIWELAALYDEVHYVLDSETFDAANDAAAIPSGIDVVSVAPNKMYSVGDARIETLESNDAGVAFYVELERTCIFFMADLNVWWWDRQDEENAASLAFCKGQLAHVSHHAIDAAFIPLDPRLVDGLVGLLTADELLQIKHIFPMHYWANQEASRKLLDDERVSRRLLERIHFDDVFEL